MSGNDAGRDWGNLRFGPRERLERAASEQAARRFAIGVAVFLLVALLYPFYDYWVQSRLAARDAARAMREMTDSLEHEIDQAGRRTARRAQAASAPGGAASAVRPLRVMGAVRTRSGPMVIVDLGDRSVGEAGPAICAQAARWLDGDTRGMALRVQRYRGREPSTNASEVRCR